MKCTFFLVVGVFILALLTVGFTPGKLTINTYQPVIPVLTGKETNPVLEIQVCSNRPENIEIEEVKINLKGTTDLNDIEQVSVFYSSKGGTFQQERQFGVSMKPEKELVFNDRFQIHQHGYFWVSIRLKNTIELLNKIGVSCEYIKTNRSKIVCSRESPAKKLRVGVALRQHMQDNADTYRIPGLTTTTKGTLLAVYDVRRSSQHDLQGDIDIGLSRSTDGGVSWEPMKLVLDMGTWGGLPQKFNGVSDPGILVDENTGEIFVAALWMHGVLDKNGKWIEGLTDSSKAWNHQWRDKASQPGFDVNETTQFIMTKSCDDGITWSEPMNLTAMLKRKEWWLFAPAPGHGITLGDGTLVFPSQGRDEKGESFSNLMWSADHGESWKVSTPAYFNTSECMAVQLSDSTVMLNIRDNRNKKDTSATNGRAIMITTDMGETWLEHATSHGSLAEPTCMACIHKHTYVKNNKKENLLLFSNPNSRKARINMTVKVSFDDGVTWPKENWLLLDELKSRGYSCITSVDNQTIGILYESSQADLVFQQVSINELTGNKQ